MTTLRLENLFRNILSKIRYPILIGVLTGILLMVLPQNSSAIGPNFDYYTKVRFEYQYSDYFDYKWPDYIEYAFGEHEFSQPNPLLSSFPEHRGLMKITQAFGPDFELELMYHYSFNGKTYEYDPSGTLVATESDEAIYYARGDYKINDNSTIKLTAQYTKTESLKGWMAVLGGDYDFGGFFKISPDVSLFWNDAGGVQSNAQSYNLKFRQALTNTTAAQIKYSYFNTDPIADQEGLQYQTLTLWLSQWLPTESALHLFFRYHVDNLEGESIGPGIEISHYLDYLTVLTLNYRHFRMTNDDPVSAFNQAIGGGDFISDAFTVLLKRTIWGDTEISLKYRYYTANQGVKMNTYLFGIEQVF